MKNISLSSSALKLIAALTMIIDHVGFLFFPEQLLWRIAGRLSFPLFAFLIAEGHERTSDARRYLLRLAAFAVISELPFQLFNRAAGAPMHLNIFFTLTAGLLALIIFKRMPALYSLPLIAALCALAQWFSFDYGAYGVLTILASALFIRQREIGAMLLTLLPFAYVALKFFLGALSLQSFAALSVPFVMLYSGEHGFRLPRFFFYWFYPVHLCILLLIRQFLF